MSSVSWQEVRLRGPVEQAARAELQLTRASFPGWVDESSHEAFCFLIYVPQEAGWEERLASLREELPGVEVASGSQVRDEDWAENWKKFYHPLQVGRRLVVCPSWEAFQPTPEQLVITLDPGSAFGTGYHWTTRLCMEFLEDSVDASCGPLLDLGTGSGLLAIAASRLGASDVTAVDNDPVAVKVAGENFAINQVSIRLELADRPPAGPFAIVVANLIASLLLEMAGSLFQCVESGGRLICGGIISEREMEVVDGLCAAGFELLEVRRREDWVSLLLRRP